MFGQPVPRPGGHSSGDSGEMGGWGPRVPRGRSMLGDRRLPTSSLKGAGGRGGRRPRGGPGRQLWEQQQQGLPAGEKRPLPWGGRAACSGPGTVALQGWPGAQRTPEERPPPKAGPACQRPGVLAPRLLCQPGIRGWLGLGPAGRPILLLRTSGPRVQPPHGEVQLCVPNPGDGKVQKKVFKQL